MDAAQTHLSPKTNDTTRSYLGQVFFDHQGTILEEVGNEVEAIAKQQIEKAVARLNGKWAFSVVKSMSMNGGSRVWDTAVLFPDGKSRKLVQGEVSAFGRKSAGTWVTPQQIMKFFPGVRIAPDVRFPWRDGFQSCRLEKFENMLALEQWVQTKVGQNNLLFVAQAAAGTYPPNEDALFIWAAIVAK